MEDLNSGIDYSTMRKIVLDVLKSGFSQYSDICAKVYLSLKDKGYLNINKSSTMSFGIKELGVEDERKVNQIVWDLIIERVLTIGRSKENNVWPFLRLTEFGESVIRNEENVIVYDINGMLKLLKDKVPSVDPVIEKYFSECLTTLRVNSMLASAVMLGCAAEKSILLLFDSYINWLKVNSTQKQYENLKKFQSSNIARKFDELTKSINGHKADIREDLLEDYDIVINSIFTIIRKTRNDSGHPTGKSIYRDELISMIYVFINHCKKVYELIEFFGGKQEEI